VSDLGLYLGVALAGAIGAPVRYLADNLVQGRSARAFPLGTLIINVTGSALLGFITGLVLYRAFPHEPQVILGTGFCGAYTTFSTFGVETVRLVEEGDSGQSALNVIGSLAGGAAGAAIGLALAAAI
jgi:CrcB protein